MHKRCSMFPTVSWWSDQTSIHSSLFSMTGAASTWFFSDLPCHIGIFRTISVSFVILCCINKCFSDIRPLYCGPGGLCWSINHHRGKHIRLLGHSYITTCNGTIPLTFFCDYFWYSMFILVLKSNEDFQNKTKKITLMRASKC